mmetsp:Transcript_9800/g.22583  ORF Transcript_9800/g.22583 Transcript_9800/m.22583 type:complete len:206 (-) Transcript_9800:118-735(-)
MGVNSSKFSEGGTLTGAYAPPIPGIDIPKVPEAERKFTVKIPPGMGPGNVFTVTILNVPRKLTVPPGHYGGSRMTVTVKGDVQKVIASTLPQLPGMEIVQAKPIVFGSVSYSYQAGSGIQGQQSMGQKVGELMQEAQSKILNEALNVGCNAVLGMSFNVTNDSSGDRGYSKLIIVTACGTPCSVVPSGSLPIVEADAVLQPLYNA